MSARRRPPGAGRRALWAVLFGALTAGPAGAAVVAPPPGREVVTLEEHVLVVYDPLTASQTIVVQHIFEGTNTPFGLLIPTPAPARVVTPSERLRRAIQNRLHPRGAVRRTLEVDFVSWAGSCALRTVGDEPEGDDKNKRLPNARSRGTNLGNAPEPIHDWLLENGFTIAPAQAAWLNELRAQGWSVAAVVVDPPGRGEAPPARLRGPVLALTHEASEPVYAAGHPPFAIDAGEGSTAALPALEVAVLTEWSVDLDTQLAPEPFFADLLTGRDIARMGSEAGGLPWAFRRDGSLTAFRIERTPGLGVLRFARTEARPPVRPAPTPRVRAHRLEIPVELLLLVVVLGSWLWLRHWKRGPRTRRLQVQ